MDAETRALTELMSDLRANPESDLAITDYCDKRCIVPISKIDYLEGQDVFRCQTRYDSLWLAALETLRAKPSRKNLRKTFRNNLGKYFVIFRVMLEEERPSIPERLWRLSDNDREKAFKIFGIGRCLKIMASEVPLATDKH